MLRFTTTEVSCNKFLLSISFPFLWFSLCVNDIQLDFGYDQQNSSKSVILITKCWLTSIVFTYLNAQILIMKEVPNFLYIIFVYFPPALKSKNAPITIHKLLTPNPIPYKKISARSNGIVIFDLKKSAFSSSIVAVSSIQNNGKRTSGKLANPVSLVLGFS